MTANNVPGANAEQKLIEIYEGQAIEAAIFLMARLNRGQIKRLRESNPQLADFYLGCLAPNQPNNKPIQGMQFNFKHKESGEVRGVFLNTNEIQGKLASRLYDELTCDCKPASKTKDVECDCEDYLHDFELLDQP